MKPEDSPFFGIREFVETLRMGTFTAAGNRLGLTGSAVGKTVTRLESKLGTKLLHRTTRKIMATPEGQHYFEGWVKILAEIDSLEQAVTAGSHNVSGQVKLHLPAAFGRKYVMPILSKLANKYPKLELAVHFSESRINLINENVDLVVRIGTLEDDADLVAKLLGYQKLTVCGSQDYFDQHGVPDTPADLLTHDCIIGSKRSSQPTWLFKDSKKQSFNQLINARYMLSDGDAMLNAALNGLGVAQLPTWLIQEQLDSNRLTSVLDTFSGAVMPINVVWPRSRYLKLSQRVIIDELAEQFKLQASLFGYSS
ncbi:LysR family transcriptional regulator [Pseudoalteromonas sp. XI10]|uniref:LysR family transcriptional regulator n=1 Tax=Pseudoalteromonas sp. XI10 TaxID=1766621 RepID=UPI0007334A1D|nr:LysR family transcriptional regulator [Pseudoalteromonas sp. XI10]KTG19662.1 LysR family transcriptional regulator [Pseudoalteromonas sp. XI10]